MLDYLPNGVVIVVTYWLYTLYRHAANKNILWNVCCTMEALLLLLVSQLMLIYNYTTAASILTIIGICGHWMTVPEVTYLSAVNKAILVTGCDRGIGHALVKKLDSLGYHVYAGCLYMGQQGEQDLVKHCSERVYTLQMDVSDASEVIQAANEVQTNLQGTKLWAVINNAGICYIGNIEIMSLEDIEKVTKINFLGPIHVCRAFLPLLRKSKGRLVNVASNAGLAPVPHLGVYCASKSALATLSEVMRYELQQWGVKVCTVVPSGYKTGILAYDKKATAERWWLSATKDVKEDFGKDCFIPEFKFGNHDTSTTADLSSIVNTIINAVSVKTPQSIYYSGFLARTLPFVYLHLPSILGDPITKVLTDWFVSKPKALYSTSRKYDNNNSSHVK